VKKFSFPDQGSATPLARAHLANHVTVVVVAEGPGQLLIVHVGLVLASAPQLGHHLRVAQLELPLLPLPVNHLPVVLVREQLQQELPQLDLTVVPAPDKLLCFAGLF
jgi:hypothetical protein